MAGRTVRLAVGQPGESERKPTVEALCRSANICGGCSLRFEGSRDAARYRTLASQSPSFVCGVCLGVLQAPSITATAALTKARLAAVSHASVFKMTVALPPSAAVVRDAAAFLWLREQAGDAAAPSDAVSLREAYKLAVCEFVEEGAGAHYHPDAEAFVNVKCWHNESRYECSLVLGSGGNRRTDAAPAPLEKRPRKGGADVSATTVVADGEMDAEFEGPSIVATRRVIDEMSPEQLRAILGDLFFPPKPPKTAVEIKVKVSVASFLVAGTYNKLSRRISQTPWFVDFQPAAKKQPLSKKSDSFPKGGAYVDDDELLGDVEKRERYSEISVEDVVVGGLREVFKPERTTFTAGGREDIDVRMLGKGRPFIVDIVNPSIVRSRVTPDMIVKSLAVPHPGSGLVVVNDLRLVPKSFATEMRTCEAEKRKHYRCVVWTSKPLDASFVRTRLEAENSTGGFCLRQKTPLRVLHRRTLLTRERRIHSSKVVRFVTPNSFVFDVVAQAGTYIKEFVHSDHGRTKPSVTELLECDADILQLDVAGVEFNATPQKAQRM